MSGPAPNMGTGWQLIREKIKMDPPTDFGLYLGCHHDLSVEGDVRILSYNMENFLEQRVDRYMTLAPNNPRLKLVNTPFLETPETETVGAPVSTGPWLECPSCAGRFPLIIFIGVAAPAPQQRERMLPPSSPPLRGGPSLGLPPKCL